MIELVAILCKTFLAPCAYISEIIFHTVSHLLLQAGLYLTMPLYSQDLDIPGKNLIYIAKNINIRFNIISPLIYKKLLCTIGMLEVEILP